MSVADITPARPRYLQWTLFRDYHYAVFNTGGEMVFILVMDKGERRSYWTSTLDPKKQNVVYENHEMVAKMMAGYYTRRSDDLMKLLEPHVPGEYFLSVVDASGKRLYDFSLWR